MFQLNMTTPPDFETNLHRLMLLRRLSSQSEAIVLAVKETIERTTHTAKTIGAPLSLEEILESQATDKKRLTLTYEENVFLAIVPIADVDVIKQLSDCIDSTYNASSRTEQAPAREKTDTLPNLADLLDRAAAQKAPITLTYQDKIFFAGVPIQAVDVIEQLEDCIDNANADEALKEKGSISLDEFIKELGFICVKHISA